MHGLGSAELPGRRRRHADRRRPRRGAGRARARHAAAGQPTRHRGRAGAPARRDGLRDPPATPARRSASRSGRGRGVDVLRVRLAPGARDIDRFVRIEAGARIGLLDVEAAGQTDHSDHPRDGFVQIRDDDVSIDAMRFNRIDRCVLITGRRESARAVRLHELFQGPARLPLQGRLGRQLPRPRPLAERGPGKPGENGLSITDSHRLRFDEVSHRGRRRAFALPRRRDHRGLPQRGRPLRPDRQPPRRPVRFQVQVAGQRQPQRLGRLARGLRLPPTDPGRQQRGRAPGGEGRELPHRPADHPRRREGRRAATPGSTSTASAASRSRAATSSAPEGPMVLIEDSRGGRTSGSPSPASTGRGCARTATT